MVCLCIQKVGKMQNPFGEQANNKQLFSFTMYTTIQPSETIHTAAFGHTRYEKKYEMMHDFTMQ